MSRQIVNIINFVRGTEPRLKIDLAEALEKQLEEIHRRKLPATFLMQYDALIDDVFVSLVKKYEDEIEIGMWLELVRPCIEKAGLKWRGREDWLWDHRGNICNPVGYAPDERILLAAECMRKFREVFGRYPESVGAWAIDAVTLAHIADNYPVKAACNCKEQWGTDGYTLWGGYVGQGYYPARNNSLIPAQTEEQTIQVPVFRMLGSDPIYQYDAGLNVSAAAADAQPVVTLEPVYTGKDGGGGVPAWVDWYLRENFNGKCLSFAYTQAGQENSFGWNAMKDGFLYQMQKLDEGRANGKWEILTLGETGEWFANTFRSSPASAVVAEHDWKERGNSSYWYCCRNYRANLFSDGNRFYIRDFYVYDEAYRERYLDTVCETEGYVFDALPVMDGNRFSGNGVRAGLYVCNSQTGESVNKKGETVYREHGNCMEVEFGTDDFGEIVFAFSEDALMLKAARGAENIAVVPRFSRDAVTVSARISNGGIGLEYNGFSYGLDIICGSAEERDGDIILRLDENGVLKIAVERRRPDRHGI